MKNEAMWLSIALVLVVAIICGTCAGNEMYRKHVMAEMVKGGADPAEVACAMGSGASGSVAEAGNACIVAAGHSHPEQPRFEP